MGRSEEERNPNASLKIQVPAAEVPKFAMKPAAALKPVLGGLPRSGGTA